MKRFFALPFLASAILIASPLGAQTTIISVTGTPNAGVPAMWSALVFGGGLLLLLGRKARR
jgi:hypothetical protein